jgi:hypothetical protein
MHRGAGPGGGSTNLCLVLNPGNGTHGLGSASAEGPSEKEGDHQETYETAYEATPPPTIIIIKLAEQIVISLNSATARPPTLNVLLLVKKRGGKIFKILDRSCKDSPIGLS